MSTNVLRPGIDADRITSQQIATGVTTSPQVGNVASVNSQARVTLVFVAPRKYEKQVIRPITYNFTTNCLNAIQNFVNDKCEAKTITNTPNLVSGNYDLQTAVMPSANETIDVRMDTTLTGKWSFALIIDRPFGSASDMGIVTSAPTRETYTGWVVNDEAVHNGIGGMSINPGAVLSVTHVSISSLGATGGIGPNGAIGGSRILSHADNDVMNNQLLGLLQPKIGDASDLYSLDANNVASYIYTTSQFDNANLGANTFGSPYSNCTNNLVEETRSTREHSTDNKNIVTHLNKLISASVDITANSARDMSNDILGTDSNVLGNVAGLVGGNSSSIGSATLNIQNNDGAFLVSELQRRFGASMNTIIVDAPASHQFELADPSANTPQNIATVIIANAMPDILASHGICDLSFAYDSTFPNNEGFGKGLFNWYIANPVFPVESAVLQRTIITLGNYLRTSVFNKILTCFGDFSLYVYSSTANNTIINVQLYNYNANSAALHDVSNIIGALNTSFIGSKETLSNNAAQMQMFTRHTVNDVAANLSGTAGYF